MNEKLQQMWDTAHEIPKGAFIPEGTVLVQAEPEDDVLSYYLTRESGNWKGSSRRAPVRSLDPLPDPNDTGTFTALYSGGDNVHVDTYDGRCYDLTESQARNLARKLTEAVDGH